MNHKWIIFHSFIYLFIFKKNQQKEALFKFVITLTWSKNVYRVLIVYCNEISRSVAVSMVRLAGETCTFYLCSHLGKINAQSTLWYCQERPDSSQSTYELQKAVGRSSTKCSICVWCSLNHRTTQILSDLLSTSRFTWQHLNWSDLEDKEDYKTSVCSNAAWQKL